MISDEDMKRRWKGKWKSGMRTKGEGERNPRRQVRRLVGWWLRRSNEGLLARKRELEGWRARVGERTRAEDMSDD